MDLGEGRCGDYNPADPTDEALLRWDAYVFCPNLEQHAAEHLSRIGVEASELAPVFGS